MIRVTLAIVALAPAALVAMAPPLFAQQPASVAGGPVATAPRNSAAASTVQIVATVEAVDVGRRSLTLKGPKGLAQTMAVGKDVRNLAQVKVGDRVAVSYAQPLALQLKKAGAGSGERAGGVQAPLNERSAGVVGREVTVVADVVAVNYDRQTVTLRGAKQTIKLAVPDAAQLRSITTGDQVQATYTEAVAVSVRAAAGMIGDEPWVATRAIAAQ
jgi:Cu/Ag efflux protein CusF